MTELLKKHREFVEWAEGRRKFPYEDSVGKLTIGVGRNLEDRGLSNKEVDFLLSNDQKIAFKEASKLGFFESLDTMRQMVIMDMVFNMGFPRFSGFVMTIAALEKKDFKTAAAEMQNSRWFRQTGRRAQRLVRIMYTGEDGDGNGTLGEDK